MAVILESKSERVGAPEVWNGGIGIRASAARRLRRNYCFDCPRRRFDRREHCVDCPNRERYSATLCSRSHHTLDHYSVLSCAARHRTGNCSLSPSLLLG